MAFKLCHLTGKLCEQSKYTPTKNNFCGVNKKLTKEMQKGDCPLLDKKEEEK